MQWFRTKGAARAALVLFCAAVWALLLAGPTVAQTVDLRQPAVDVLTWLAGVLVTVLTVLASVGIRFVLAKFGLAKSQYEQNLNDRLNDIIHKGIDYALANAINEVNKPGAGLAAVKFDNYFISLVASYVAPRAPEILARFKVTQEKLEDMIWARILPYTNTVPISGGASTPASVREVNRATGGPNTPAPVVVETRAETPLPEAKGSGIFTDAPNTGS